MTSQSFTAAPSVTSRASGTAVKLINICRQAYGLRLFFSLQLTIKDMFRPVGCQAKAPDSEFGPDNGMRFILS